MSTAESDDSCAHVVAVLSNGWRVVERLHGIKRVLQYRSRAETVARHVWRSRSCSRTKEALIRCCDERACQIIPTARMMLIALPERISSESPTISHIEVTS
jgi:hypothetical protein